MIRLSGVVLMAVSLTSASWAEPAPAKSIPLEVLEPAQRTGLIRDFPVSVGLVFPEGELRAAPGGALRDDRGQPVPFEAEATGWWSPKKDSVKWLLLRFQASTDRQYTFKPDGKPTAFGGEPLASEQGEAIVVRTGPLEAQIHKSKPGLFQTLELNDQPMLTALDQDLVLVADDDENETEGTLADWDVTVEASTPFQASIKATGYYQGADDKPIARLDLRYGFFRDESFVRLEHTLTWMLRKPEVGIRELAVRLRPAMPEAETVRVGRSDYTPDAFQATGNVLALQEEGDRFSITVDGKAGPEGKHLGGWVALSGAEGRSVSLSLRHAWETFPTAFAVRDGETQVQLWPSEGERLRFTPDGIMPPDFFHSNIWKHFWFSMEEGHHVNEYRYRRGNKGEKIPSPFYLYTAEGVALTHEMTLGFHDARTSRTPAELNSLTQHPMVLRQDPASALRVPFMGFDLMPVDRDKHPNVERAVDLLGRMAMMRWVKQHSYGFLRFGMVRWAYPLYPSTGLYRWMDNVQYDQQLIPWMLFMRGGDRQFYEDGQIVSRYAMDVNTNHYNTRGFPTGYQATCGGGMPFPHLGFLLWNMKGQKIHFLSYAYHLTGSRRAKEVLDEVIAGTKKFVLSLSDDPAERHSTAREIYNMNQFWVTAYEETWDPEIGKLCRESREFTASREYNAELNVFRAPQVYLYNGMVMQQRLSGDPKLREAMLRHLGANMLCIEDLHGVRSVMDTIGCPWAYEQTQNPSYADAAWDVARTLADLIPDADLDPDKPIAYVYCGNQILRHFLMPILAGASLGDRLGYAPDRPFRTRDAFFYLQPVKGELGKARVAARVRARRDGDLKLRALLRGQPGMPVAVRATQGDDAPVAELTLEASNAAAAERHTPRTRNRNEGELVLPQARKGAIYAVTFEGRRPRAQVRLVGDADIVYHFPPDDQYAAAPLSGGQYYAGVRLFTRSLGDTVTVETNSNIYHIPYTLRDAETGELIHRYALGDPLRQEHKVGQGRLLQFLMAGARAYKGWRFEGVSPWFAASKGEWFDPAE